MLIYTWTLSKSRTVTDFESPGLFQISKTCGNHVHLNFSIKHSLFLPAVQLGDVEELWVHVGAVETVERLALRRDLAPVKIKVT
jgi:hypothetical protein